ncbi:MAG: hypothetical protein ACI4EY_04860 [Lachnospiraceae bacterium]
MYKIGNIIIEITNLNPKNYSSRLELFRAENGIIDAEFQIQYINKFDIIQNAECIYRNSQFAVMVRDNRKLYCYMMNNYIYAVLEDPRFDNNIFKLYLEISFFSGNIHPYFLPSLLGLERLLIKKKSFVLYSSYIYFKNNGLLFTAPSGGGKSTQAELWKQYKNAIIVNGDKSIIGKRDNQWIASGLPFSGSSIDCKNITTPLRAIVILNKGTENQLQEVGIRGFSNLLSQVTVNPWDKMFCNMAMNLVIDVCNEVPIYYYSCTKTKEAVDVLYQEFIEKGILDGTI